MLVSTHLIIMLHLIEIEEDDDTKTAYTSSTQKREKLSTSDETGSQGISRLGTTPKSKGDLSTGKCLEFTV